MKPAGLRLLLAAVLFLAWIGWMALNGAGAVVFTGIGLNRLPGVAMNTTLCAASGWSGSRRCNSSPGTPCACKAACEVKRASSTRNASGRQK